MPYSYYCSPSCDVLIGSLVMEHPGLSATPILGKPIIFGTVFGSIG